MRILHLCPLLLLLSVATHAASFACSKATTANEKSICANPTLSALDQQYAKLYKSAKISNSNNKNKLNQIKSVAVNAFKLREKLCNDQLCLLDWYQTRIAILKDNEHISEPKLSTNQLYYSFDLRTMPSSFGQQLKVDCKSHLADYFPVLSPKNMTETSVSMEYNDRAFVMEIRGNSRFYHQDIITNA